MVWLVIHHSTQVLLIYSFCFCFFLKDFFIYYTFSCVYTKSVKLIVYGECMEAAGLLLYLLTLSFIITAILLVVLIFVSHHNFVNIMGKSFKNSSKCPYLSLSICLFCFGQWLFQQFVDCYRPHWLNVKMNVHTLLYRFITSLWITSVSRINFEYIISILFAVFDISTGSNSLSSAYDSCINLLGSTCG
jgi:hypothetical protein